MGKADAIGLFDSGVGGLTVAEEVFRALPGEPIVYFGDTANVPYGGRPVDELILFADMIISFLIGQGAKYIVFACNTSSAVSLDVMRRRYDVPMMGLIQPGAQAAAAATHGGRIGVIATEATIRSGAYERAIHALAPDVDVFQMPAPRLVPLVEAGDLNTSRTEAALREYLNPLRCRGIDTLLLGCTHYPLLAHAMERILGPDVVLVNPAVAAVAAVRNDMVSKGLLSIPSPVEPVHRFFVSGDPVSFAHVAALCTGRLLVADRLRLTS